MDRTEDELIRAIARVLSSDDADIVLGIGDDAAIVEPRSGQQVLTTDLLVERVHFEREAISARDLGAKAMTVNVSDVAAMGASPRFALVSIALPLEIETSWVMELVGGMREACVEYAVSVVGGDLNRAALVVLSVTVVGEVAPGRAVTRSGAAVGDRVVVTGSLGAAAGGLALSRLRPADAAAALSEPWGRPLAQALARPTARVGEGQLLARSGATAMMDLSDGLAKDLARLCDASGVRARVQLERVPVSEDLRLGAERLGADALELAISGGEDYELLATMPLDAVANARTELRDTFGLELTDLGEIVEGSGVVALGARGETHTLAPTGWDHFAGR